MSQEKEAKTLGQCLDYAIEKCQLTIELYGYLWWVKVIGSLRQVGEVCTRIYDRQAEILATSPKKKGLLYSFTEFPLFGHPHNSRVLYIALIRIPFMKGGRPLHMSSPSMPCKGDVPAESFGLCNQSMQRSKRGAKSRHRYVVREVVFC